MWACVKSLSHYRTSVAPYRCFKFHSPVGENSLRASFPAALQADKRLVCGASCLCESKRFLSKSTHQWISRIRFGTNQGIFFGVPLDAIGEVAELTRKLYCCALVYASGGSRMGRDWIAGCSALLATDDTLLSIALQHPAKVDDVAIFRSHILEQLLESSMQADKSTRLEQPISASVSNPLEVACPSEAKPGEKISQEQIHAVENFVLQASPIVRCFLYDGMTASLFKCRAELSILEETRERMFRLNSEYFGVPIDDFMAIWRLVETEFILRAEKNRILGQPWDD